MGLLICSINGLEGPSALPSLSLSSKTTRSIPVATLSLNTVCRTYNLSAIEIIPLGLSTAAYSVCLSAIPSLSSSTNFIIIPLPGCFPNEPIISTPTYTSPEAEAAIQEGLGVRPDPANDVTVNSCGQFKDLLNESTGTGLLTLDESATLFLQAMNKSTAQMNAAIIFCISLN